MDGDTVFVFGVGSLVCPAVAGVRRGGAYSSFWYKKEDVHSVSSVVLGNGSGDYFLSFGIYDFTAGVDSCALALSA